MLYYRLPTNHIMRVCQVAFETSSKNDPLTTSSELKLLFADSFSAA